MPVLPGIDELLEALINGYEDVIRRSCDLQRTIARGVPIEPVRSILDTTADLTRDIAAVQLSGARWLLDS
jgi:predicted transcriptional regulator